ncbi:hypothetical protein OP10G_1057 [Fimbriimonas ginsengisoli Gsoil 348]|uniref:Uncharacterized protein n=1 Tax=Fimbriimonas ginsengisoli Gsoil 348 TaxID=661478 RepID=A0A068NNU0_FIMGI|nr:hypothetical protein OP10G_1057 [Fimbriimonas ginsengisoli Gsoil 348]
MSLPKSLWKAEGGMRKPEGLYSGLPQHSAFRIPPSAFD